MSVVNPETSKLRLSPQLSSEIWKVIKGKWSDDLFGKLVRGAVQVKDLVCEHKIDLETDRGCLEVTVAVGNSLVDDLLKDLEERGYLTRNGDWLTGRFGPNAEVSPPGSPQNNKRSGRNEMDDTLRQALGGAARVYDEALKVYLVDFRRAEAMARAEAVNTYVDVSGADWEKVKETKLIAHWRQMGWWPPKRSYQEDRHEFYSTLKERIETGQTWDGTPVRRGQQSSDVD